MKKTIVAGAALLAGIAIAWPEVGWSADDMPQAAPSEPVGQTMPRMAHRMMGDIHGQDESSPMRRLDGMHDMMMRRMVHATPQQRCEERLARRAGMVAYTGAKLNLTAEQQPLWGKLNAALQAAGAKQRQLCEALGASTERGQVTVLDRLNRTEQRLSARLDALHQVRPALEQLYQALTPEQKATIDRSFKHG
jgi:hypothetical protein